MCRAPELFGLLLLEHIRSLEVQPRHAVVELWSRNTVRRYLREGEAAAVRKPAPKRAEKLDPFKAYIVDRVKAAAPDRIPAIVLFREIKARGHDGGEGDLAQWHVVGAQALGLELAL